MLFHGHTVGHPIVLADVGLNALIVFEVAVLLRILAMRHLNVVVDTDNVLGRTQGASDVKGDFVLPLV